MGIKVLHFVSSLGGGGVARVLLNYLSVFTEGEIQSDFVVHGNRVGELECHFRDLGATVTHAPPKKKSLVANARVIKSAIAARKYDVVHAHQNFSNALPLLLARAQEVPVRISHGHGFPNLTPLVAWSARRAILGSATNLVACSEDVGRWIHGSGWDRARFRAFVMRNAIDSEAFLSGVGDRSVTRSELGLEGHRVLLQLGRLSEEKNHEFSLDVMELLRDDPVWKLAIVGSGPLSDKLRASVDRRGLNDRVLFTGFRDDVPAIMNASDVLLLPSHTEGFPMVTTEAQALGLPVIVSPAVTIDARITDEFVQVPLDAALWKSAVARFGARESSEPLSEVVARGFDIRQAAAAYLQYLQMALD